jgi:signal transduction histidine kinase
MKSLIMFLSLCVCAALLFQVSPTRAQDAAAVQLAAESEAYCKSTIKDKPTSPAVIIEKVNAACELLKKEGMAAFSKFKGKGSEFLFEGTYIWIHDLEDAKMLMHPIKPAMEGNIQTGLKDVEGKRFFATMNKLAREKGSGWVGYMWPVPGSDKAARKVSYVKACKSKEGKDLVAGCGIYKASEEDLKKLEIL